MPIPLLVWAAAAAGAAYIAWQNRDKIADFFDSEEGRRLIRGTAEAVKGHMEPYKQMIDTCYTKDSDERRIFFSEAKKRMTKGNWDNLVAYGKLIGNGDPKYLAVIVDLLYIDEHED